MKICCFQDCFCDFQNAPRSLNVRVEFLEQPNILVHIGHTSLKNDNDTQTKVKSLF